MTSLTLNNSLVSPLYNYPFTDTKNISLGNSTRFAGLSGNMSSLRNAKMVSLSGDCDSQSNCAAQKTWYNNFTGIIPNGVNLISAIVVGAGGGSGGNGHSCDQNGNTGGGGGGGLAYGYIRVNPGDTFRGTIGGGGRSCGRSDWSCEGGGSCRSGGDGGTGGTSQLEKLISGTTWKVVMSATGGGGSGRNNFSVGGGGGSGTIDYNYVLTSTPKYLSGAVAGGGGGKGEPANPGRGAGGPTCPLNNVQYGGGGGGGRWEGGRGSCGEYGGGGGGGRGGGFGNGDDMNWIRDCGQKGADGLGGGAGGQGWRGTSPLQSGGNGTIIVKLNP